MATHHLYSLLVIFLVVHAPPIHTRPTQPSDSAAREEEGSRSRTNELFRRYHVHITNDMTGDTPNVDIQCWSKDDDLPKRTLWYQQEYLIRFKIDLMRTTRFLCFMTTSAPPPNYKELQFEAFVAWRDESRCHKGTCYWSIRTDGLYFSRFNVTWDREYEWRSPTPSTTVTTN